MKRLSLLIFMAILFGCNTGSSGNGDAQLPVVAIQPFGKIDSSILHAVGAALQKEFQCRVQILAARSLPSQAYYKPRNRYRADKLISYLKEETGEDYFSVVGVTTKDISTTVHGLEDWGVMGLGYQPGQSCIISSFRSGRTAKDQQHLAKRMAVLGLHEFGHNLSLPHCGETFCIMQDAEGKNKLDQSKQYCERCKSKMQSANRLKKK